MRDLLASPPTAGTGFHGWLFRVARGLFTCGRNEADVRAILENAADACGRNVPAREIDDAIKNAARTAHARQPYSAQQKKAWPPVDEVARKAITAGGGGLVVVDSSNNALRYLSLATGAVTRLAGGVARLAPKLARPWRAATAGKATWALHFQPRCPPPSGCSPRVSRVARSLLCWLCSGSGGAVPQ
jgi:hypothetical protein